MNKTFTKMSSLDWLNKINAFFLHFVMNLNTEEPEERKTDGQKTE